MVTGEQFKEQLRRMGVTQRWAAEQLGVTPTSVYRWCAGLQRVPRHAALGLALLRKQDFDRTGRVDRDVVEGVLNMLCAAHESGRRSCPLMRQARGIGR
jgi:hypothetical protein